MQPSRNFGKYSSIEDCISKITPQLLRRIPPNCSCPQSCHETTYRSSLTYSGTTKADVQLYLYYRDKKITSINEVEDYPLHDLLGSLGGTLGLCIGMSIVSFIELVVYLVFLFLNCQWTYLCKNLYI